MDLKTLYSHLQRYSDFSQDHDPTDRYNTTNRFLDTVETIVTHADPEAIPVFLAYLDDLHTPPEVNTALQRYILYYSLPSSLMAVFDNLAMLLNKAPLCTADLLCALLDKMSTPHVLYRLVQATDKDLVARLIQALFVGHFHYADLVTYMAQEGAKTRPPAFSDPPPP